MLWFGTEKLANNPQLVLSRPQHPLKVQIGQTPSLQDHHILPKWNLSKISPFKTPHPPKVKIIKNQFF